MQNNTPHNDKLRLGFSPTSLGVNLILFERESTPAASSFFASKKRKYIRQFQ